MRETGFVRKQFEGDLLASQQLTGVARVLLGQLKLQMEVNKLQQLSRTVTLSDGTVIKVASNFGVDKVTIDTPILPVPSGSSPESAGLASTLAEYAFRMTSTGADAWILVAASQNFSSLGAPSTLKDFILRDGKVAAIDAVAINTVRIKAIKRALTNNLFDHVEGLVRSMDTALDGTGTLLDAALYCSEGFFVDPATIAGKSYEADLSAAVSSRLGAFSHAALPTLTYALPSEFTRTPVPPASQTFNYSFVVYDPVRRPLANTYHTNEGAGTINSEMRSTGASYDNVPIGTSVFQEFMLRRQVTDNLYVTHKYQDVLYRRSEWWSQNYYTVLVNDGVSLMTGTVNTTTDGLDSAQEGYLSNTVFRRQARRERSGWVETQVTQAPIDALPFISDANTPPTILTPAPASADTLADHENLDLSRVAFGRLTYTNPADISFTAGPKGPPSVSVFPEPPRGGAFSQQMTNSAFGIDWMYRQNKGGVVENAPLVEMKRSTFTDAFGQEFYLTTKDVMKVVTGGTTTAINTATAAGSIVALPAFTLQRWTYNTPQGMATRAAMRNAGRATITMEYYQIRRVTQPVVRPAANGNFFGVYQASTGKYLFYKFNASGGPFAAFQMQIFAQRFLCKLAGLTTGEPLVDGLTLEQHMAQIMALIDILGNTGLPDEVVPMCFNPAAGGEIVVLL